MSSLTERFSRLHTELKYLIIREIPAYLQYSHNLSWALFSRSPLLKSYLDVYCECCRTKMRKMPHPNSRFQGEMCSACFNLDCYHDFGVHYYDMYDYCEKCGKATRHSGNDEGIIFYCEDCRWWWAYHCGCCGESNQNHRVKFKECCKPRATYVGWISYYGDGGDGGDGEQLFTEVMPGYDETYYVKDLYSKSTIDKYNLDEHDRFGFQQMDLLVFKCEKHLKIFKIDPIGS